MDGPEVRPPRNAQRRLKERPAKTTDHRKALTTPRVPAGISVQQWQALVLLWIL